MYWTDSMFVFPGGMSADAKPDPFPPLGAGPSTPMLMFTRLKSLGDVFVMETDRAIE
jgi:hypothetical protein